MNKKKLIVIGGGFAGSEIARKLENDFNVTLVDTKEYFEFTPGVLRVLVEPSFARKIQVLHAEYLKRAEVVLGDVKQVGEDFVRVNGRTIKFDYLVICSGSRYDAPFKEQGVVLASRGEHLAGGYNALCSAKRVLIVGGGLVGVELAGEIVDKFKDKNITIVHSGENLIERNSAKAIDYAVKSLVARGVKVIYGERVKKVEKGFCLTDKGRKIKGDLFFVCTGIKPNFEFLPRGWLEERGVNVNGFLQVVSGIGVVGGGRVFAAGDITAIRKEKTAQNAERQAEVVVKNIKGLESGRRLVEFVSKRTPMVISLGKRDGIYDNGRLVITGAVPAFLKWGIRVKEMWKKDKFIFS